MGGFYAVTRMVMSVDAQLPWGVQEVPLSFAKGMIGMIPVFDSEENAIEYAGDGDSIVNLVRKSED